MNKKRPRLLIVTERFFPEEFNINELVQELRSDYDITVLTQNPSYPYDAPFPGWGNPLFSIRREQGVRVIRGYSLLGYKRSVLRKILNYLFFAGWISILGLLACGKQDKIFVYHTGPLTLAFPAWLLSHLNNKKYVIWTQDVWPDTVWAWGIPQHPFLERFLNSFVRMIYRRSRAVLVSCEGFTERLRGFARKQPIIYVPNWSNLADGSTINAGSCSEAAIESSELTVKTQAIQKASDAFSFMFAGNIGTVQNLEAVISAFQLVQKEHPRARLDILGDGAALKGLKDQAAHLGCDSLFFHGRVPREQMATWYKMADALIVSLADRDIFSLTVPQKFQTYLAAGKPILSAVRGEVSRLVAENNLGVCATPPSIINIQAAMLRLLEMNTTERITIQKAQVAFLSQEYDKPNIIRRIASALL